MSAEFLKDDVKNIWFSYASKIRYRRGKTSASDEDIGGGMTSEQKKQLQIAQQEELADELAIFKEN